MDAYFERLILGAATIDEILSNDFETAVAETGDRDLATRRIDAWCRAAAGGDHSLFARRLAREGLALEQVFARFAAARRKATATPPAWISDAVWIVEAMRRPVAPRGETERFAFEELLAPVAEQADALLWSDIGAHAAANVAQSARLGLRQSLLRQLSELAAPTIYERFAATRKSAGTGYHQFIADTKAGGILQVLEASPVLLRLMAKVAQQWIETSREFIQRLEVDLTAIRRNLVPGTAGKVASIAGELSDPHNNGRSVRIVTFEDGARVVYKPKDLQLDVAWHGLIERLNAAGAPLALKAVRTLARDGYGWTEFVEHTGTDRTGCELFFRRAGAWLALLHCFAASDMHQENLIAAADHPVPIDLETLLQAPAEEPALAEPEELAFDAAADVLASSVLMVGLLPAYGRSPDNQVFAIGGMTADWDSRTKIVWDHINSDAMRPAKISVAATANPNLPHVGGHYARLEDHLEIFIAGFAAYANFLLGRKEQLFDGFASAPVRRVIRPTRFYTMLLMRLRNYKSMNDGVMWSAQADFIARVADWDKDRDPLWPVQRPERAALLALNVPHFVMPSDGSVIGDAAGFAMHTAGMSGLERARARVAKFDAQEIAWQVELIRENTGTAVPAKLAAPKLAPDAAPPSKDMFIEETNRIADDIARAAIRRGPGAAWIGLDWLGDAKNYQLVTLGYDFYNGNAGISFFLAAHAAVTGAASSAALAHEGLARLRKNLKSRNAARLARALGLGGATGLGSIVYSLTVTAKLLRDDALLVDAHAAAALFTDDLIAADKLFDVVGGSAGAILSLLRLYRDTQSAFALERATKCGEHLLAQGRLGPEGRRSWVGQGLGPRPLNGMSHGAAGFAYALASLAAVTGRDEFAQVAAECIAFEDTSYDDARKNWPDLRNAGEPAWPCQWCHGAPGIGLARLATRKRAAGDTKDLAADVGHAVEGATRGWPAVVDTLCCGTLGSVEFLCEAAGALDRPELRDLAARQLAAVLQSAAATGDYRWNSGKRQFNLSLFRGLAGVGYTALRQVDRTLPDILIWE
jgi:type 2 lantibiotic biosynthesis protein LanM